jgi:hypothetical protein
LLTVCHGEGKVCEAVWWFKKTGSVSMCVHMCKLQVGCKEKENQFVAACSQNFMIEQCGGCL